MMDSSNAGEDNMAARIPPNFRRVITAASGGNVIEWYDFYIFGSLAAILSVKFFEKSHPVAALLSTIALFTAGFLIRPLGAFLFGWMGDRIGSNNCNNRSTRHPEFLGPRYKITILSVECPTGQPFAPNRRKTLQPFSA
jgi:MFS family permease